MRTLKIALKYDKRNGGKKIPDQKEDALNILSDSLKGLGGKIT